MEFEFLEFKLFIYYLETGSHIAQASFHVGETGHELFDPLEYWDY